MAADQTKYEKTEDGRYWVPESELNSNKYMIFGDFAIFVPRNFITFEKFLHIYGIHTFGDKWTGREMLSSFISCDKDGVFKLDTLIRNGKYDYIGEPSSCRFSGESYEYLVDPITQEQARIARGDFRRMDKILDLVRNLLFEGKIIAYTNFLHHLKIEPRLWVGDLWDVALFGINEKIQQNLAISIVDPEQEIHLSEYRSAEIYFEGGDAEALFSQLNTEKHTDQLAADLNNIELSPYLTAAILISKKFHITEDSPQKLDTLIEDILSDWPKECGEKTPNKAKMLARMVRWPSHETGGNRKVQKPS
ncbi:MAG: hypothetical protein GY751_07145 [Bacteroidetes bacterium]|nr:hypothetical protein [Bacteroidota bacterium]